jgi:hypothetical protein
MMADGYAAAKLARLVRRFVDTFVNPPRVRPYIKLAIQRRVQALHKVD